MGVRSDHFPNIVPIALYLSIELVCTFQAIPIYFVYEM
jgi:hypothetical protein